MDPVQQLIQQFTAAIKSVSLYPAAHPSRKNPRDNAFKTIEQLHKRFPVIELAIREEVLTVNGEPLFESSASADELYERMLEANFTAVQFLRGLQVEELGVFLEMLSSEEESFTDATQFQQMLEHAGVQHIQVQDEDDDIEGRAVAVYGEATDYIKELWHESRLGRIPKGDDAVKIIDEMSMILEEDRSPLVGLTMLSDYDNYTFNHSVNVGVFAMALSKEYGYSKDDEKVVGLGGLLHDVGKTRVPIEIINKPGKLDPEEWHLMQRHPVYSGELVQQMGLSHIHDIVYQHHCGANRSGYPNLPDNKTLSEGAMITAVVDVYDSMTTTRPYQRCYTPQESIEVLFRLRDRGHLMADMVEAFTRTLGIYPVGTCVRLDNGSVAFVTSVYKGDEQKPVVKVFRSAQGESLAEPELLDLREEKRVSIAGTLDPSMFGVKAAEFVDPAPVLGRG